MPEYVNIKRKRFPDASKWDMLLEYRRLQRGQYTREEFDAKVEQIMKKRNKEYNVQKQVEENK